MASSPQARQQCPWGAREGGEGGQGKNFPAIFLFLLHHHNETLMCRWRWQVRWGRLWMRLLGTRSSASTSFWTWGWPTTFHPASMPWSRFKKKDFESWNSQLYKVVDQMANEPLVLLVTSIKAILSSPCSTPAMSKSPTATTSNPFSKTSKPVGSHLLQWGDKTNKWNF